MKSNSQNLTETEKKYLVDTANQGKIINLQSRTELEPQPQIKDLEKPLLERTPPICLSKGQHPKQHACIPAKFTINPNLEQNLRIGVFRKAKTYNAWVRFSNSGKMDDRKKGVLGLAIKLIDVDGNGRVQDFLLINKPIFFASTVADYMDILKFQSGGLISKLLGLFKISLLKSLRIVLCKISKKQVHPLSQKYWSAAPFKHGKKYRVKYILEPTTSVPKTRAKSHNALSKFLVDKLNYDGAVFEFEFYLHVSDGTNNMPIYNWTKKWNEKVNRFHAATLTISGCTGLAQKLERNSREFGEKLSFSPGNCLPEHEPYGELNRIRMQVYAEVAKQRRQTNWNVTTTDDGKIDGTTAFAGAWPLPEENPTVCPFHTSDE